MTAWAFAQPESAIAPMVWSSFSSCTLTNKNSSDPGRIKYDIERPAGTKIGEYTVDGTNANYVIGACKNTSGGTLIFDHNLKLTLPDSGGAVTVLDLNSTVPGSSEKTQYFPYPWDSHINSLYPNDLVIPGFSYNGRYYVRGSKELSKLSHQKVGSNYVVKFVGSKYKNLERDTTEKGITIANNVEDYITIYAHTTLAASLNAIYGTPAGSLSTLGRWTIVFNNDWRAAGYTHYLSSAQWDTMAAALEGKIDAIVCVTAAPQEIIPEAFHKKQIKCFYYMSSLGVRWTGAVDSYGATEIIDNGEYDGTYTYNGETTEQYLKDANAAQMQTDCQGWNLLNLRGSGANSPHDMLLSIAQTAIDKGYDGIFFDHAAPFYCGTDPERWVGGDVPHATESWQYARTAFVTDVKQGILNRTPVTGTGSISGNVLTITAINDTSGDPSPKADRFAIGQVVSWTGGGGGTAVITAFGGGAGPAGDGGTGTYTLDSSHTVGSQTISGSPVPQICGLGNYYNAGLHTYDFLVKEALWCAWGQTDLSPWDNWTVNDKSFGDKWTDNHYPYYHSNLVIGHKGLSPLMNRTAFRNWGKLANSRYYVQGPNILAISGEGTKFDRSLFAWDDIHANLVAYDAVSPWGTDIVYNSENEPIIARGTSVISPVGETTITFNWPTFVLFIGDPAGGGSHTLALSPDYAKWDSAKKNANITLSNGDLTATNGGTNVKSNVFATDKDLSASKGCGLFYWEVTITTASGIGSTSVGIGNVGTSTANAEYLGKGLDSVGLLGSTGGGIFMNGVNTGWAWSQPYTSGHTIGIALDRVAKKIWFKNLTTGSPWNNDIGGANSDPVTGVGGFDLTANGCTVCNSDVLAGATLFANGATAAVLFKTPGRAGYAPAGYGQYDQQSLTMKARGLYIPAERKTTGWHWSGYGFAAYSSSLWVEGDFRIYAAPTGAGSVGTTVKIPVMTVPGPTAATREKQASTYFTAKHIIAHVPSAPNSVQLRDSGGTQVGSNWGGSLGTSMDIDISSFTGQADWTKYEIWLNY